MKKNLLFSVLLLTFALSACSNDLMIAEGDLTEEESILLKSFGGAGADHFEIIGQIPKDYELYLAIEQYENGEFIHNKMEPFPVNLDGKDRTVSFAVITDSDKRKVLFGDSTGVTTMEIETPQGGSSSGKTFEGEIPIKPDEPVYLAYWYSESGGMSKGTEGDLEDIKSRELSYLFKAELKKK